MGASQSSETPTAEKVCYYELLQVERSASGQEIRSAYRKLALVHHPDKNIGQEDEAAEAFAEIQTAYEILSDPDQRAWYDSHRDQILYGDSVDKNPSTPNGAPRSGGRSSTAADLMKFFDPTLFRIHDDSDKGLFAVARQIFQRIAEEEREAAEDEDESIINQRFPGFGDSKSSWEHHVKPFYAAWSLFSSLRPFSYADQYRYSDAPDRRVRRAMEKENRRLRDGARREYNDTVRAFVTFIKKRDPRVEKIDPQTSKEERLEAQRQAIKAQRSRDRAAYLANAKVDEYQEPEWAKVDAEELEEILYGYDQPKQHKDGRSKNNEEEEEEEDDDDDDEQEDTADVEESDQESIIEEFECLACDKIFKTEAQLNTHEKSKKHIKAVRQLRRQMLKEGVELGVDEISVEQEQEEVLKTSLANSAYSSETDDEVVAESDFDDRPEEISKGEEEQEEEQEAQEEVREQEDTENDNGKSKLTAQDIIAELDALNIKGKGGGFKATSSGVKPRKVKSTPNNKKASSDSKDAQDNNAVVGHTCITCGARFQSKNRLFDHVNTMKHAAPAIKTNSGKGNKKKNKKRK